MATGVQTYKYARLRVAYFEVTVPAVAVGRTVYFPVRALCKVLGLAAPMQRKRVRADSRLAEHRDDIPIPTNKGMRDTLCVRKQGLSIWLTAIEPSHCTIAKTRELLERFQREVFAAADRFLWGDQGVSVYDEATKTSAPLTGVLRGPGECPHCGGRVCVTLDADGFHLMPAPDAEDDDTRP